MRTHGTSDTIYINKNLCGWDPTAQQAKYYLYRGKLNMWNMVWPLLLIVGSNCFYNICAKSMPQGTNTFGALAVTYLVGAVLSSVLFVASVKPAGVITEISKVNWTSFVLGLSIVGLEAGYVFLYRAGWKVNNGALTANICLAVALLIIGALLYKESISIRQLAGFIVCAVGLFLING